METREKVLFLTFDDGPVPGPTEFVLDTLRSHAINATFFSIGENIRRHPDIYRRMQAEHHTLGNHTFNHLSGWKTGTREYVNNVERCMQEMQSQSQETGQGVSSSALFRPPYGRITRKQIEKLHPFKIIMWDVLSMDYSHMNEDRCLSNTIRATRKGSIIVFHDSYKAEKNLMYVLPRYVDHFLSCGFGFKAIQG
jgi:peptidoglycan/xylan/chitin deacetylase (PgdA/CDA1 family)